MKLRTRIILISCMAVLAACLVSDVLILHLTGKSYQNEAYVKAYQNAYMMLSQLEQGLLEFEGNTEEAVYLEYYLKQNGDDYDICFCNTPAKGKADSTIYNHTLFTREYLMSLTYNSDKNMEYTYLDWEGGSYIVFGRIIKGDLQYYRIEDITYVREKQEHLLVSMILITAGVVGATILFLQLILKRMLKPLQKLNDSAGRIAKGQYDERIPVERSDEIGQLSETFNEMAAAVEHKTKSLEESEYRKTLFMGNLTHELKTPMTAISGYAQTLLTVRLGEEAQEEALQYIYQECGRLERLSRKMLKLLELDQETELKRTDIPIRRIFDAAGRACQSVLDKKKLSLSLEENGEVFLLEEDLMTEALINLIDNAAKASEEGGKIILRAGYDFIEVEDYGKGIPPEEQERILEPFYMVDKSRSRKSGGAGLGLALTAVIARCHNCRIAIDSREGEGTRIRLQFV